MLFARPFARIVVPLAMAAGVPACAPNGPRIQGPSHQPGTELTPAGGSRAPGSQRSARLHALERWSFHAGAPLAAPPAIGPDGSVLVVTVEGYLHGLRPDGSFRWSYTLKGRPVGRPIFGDDGVAYAAAEPYRLYAIDADGGLEWVVTVPGGVKSGPVADGEGRTWLATGGGSLLAFSRRGAISGFARIAVPGLLGPVAAEPGRVAVAEAGGVLQVAGRPGRTERATCDEAPRDLRAGTSALYVVSERGLTRFALAPLAVRWRRSEVTRLVCTAPALVTEERARLRWLSIEGEPRASVALPPGTNALACDSDGSVLAAVPGALIRLGAGKQLRRLVVPAGDVLALEPAPGGLVVLAYRDGRLLAVEKDGES